MNVHQQSDAFLEVRAALAAAAAAKHLANGWLLSVEQLLSEAKQAGAGAQAAAAQLDA